MFCINNVSANVSSQSRSTDAAQRYAAFGVKRMYCSRDCTAYCSNCCGIHGSSSCVLPRIWAKSFPASFPELSAVGRKEKVPEGISRFVPFVTAPSTRDRGGYRGGSYNVNVLLHQHHHRIEAITGLIKGIISCIKAFLSSSQSALLPQSLFISFDGAEGVGVEGN